MTGKIVGGAATDASADVSGNVIAIGRDADVSEARILGSDVPVVRKARSAMSVPGGGNMLHLEGYHTAVNVAGFSTINFVADNLANDGRALLTLTDTNGTDLTGTTIRQVNIGGGSQSASVGSSFNLIASAGQLTADPSMLEVRTIRQGVSLWYDVASEVTDHGVSARITGKRADPSVGIFSASRLSTVEFLNQGADFATGQGLDRAMASVDAGQGFGVFGSVSGSESRHTTGGGSGVKASGSHFLVGAAARLHRGTDADLLAGGFVQAGWGNVDGHNNWTKGQGDTHYYGLGLMATYRQKTGAAKGLYGEAHVQAGRASTAFNSDLYDGAGNRGRYDKGSAYYGAGLGIGFVKETGANYSVDVSAHYKWMHLNGANTEIVGDPYRFDAIDSHRTRVGARVNYTANKPFTPYVGLAWEHEFSGKAAGSVHDVRIDERSLKGNSGLVEVGVSFKPDVKSAWRVDANVEGVFGQREGVQGRLMVNYAF